MGQALQYTGDERWFVWRSPAELGARYLSVLAYELSIECPLAVAAATCSPRKANQDVGPRIGASKEVKHGTLADRFLRGLFLEARKVTFTELCQMEIVKCARTGPNRTVLAELVYVGQVKAEGARLDRHYWHYKHDERIRAEETEEKSEPRATQRATARSS